MGFNGCGSAEVEMSNGGNVARAVLLYFGNYFVPVDGFVNR